MITLTPEQSEIVTFLSQSWKDYSSTRPGEDVERLVEQIDRTVARLLATHPDYVIETGALRYDDEEAYDKAAEEGTLPEYDDASDAIQAVAASWSSHREASTLGQAVDAFVAMSNSMSDLISWHPNYDYEVGEIVPGFVRQW